MDSQSCLGFVLSELLVIVVFAWLNSWLNLHFELIVLLWIYASKTNETPEFLIKALMCDMSIFNLHHFFLLLADTARARHVVDRSIACIF